MPKAPATAVVVFDTPQPVGYCFPSSFFASNGMKLTLTGTAWLMLFLMLVPVTIRAQEASETAAEAAPATPAEFDKKTVQLWEDYIHYLRIAQVDQSTSSGTALLEAGLSDEQWVQLVDEVSSYKDYDKTLVTAMKMQVEEISGLAQKIDQRIREARLGVAREGKQVRDSIEKLDDGLRARLNATERLKKAGEYAAPHLLEVLLSDAQVDRTLRPYVIEAMVAVGRPVVAPLCESLAELPPVPKQQVAEVLARIGYPVALPYLRAEIIRPGVDKDTLAVLETAFNQVIERSNVPKTTDAPGLFLMLGEDYYNNRGSLVLQPDAPFNLLWTYTEGVGLTAMEIPTPVFHDAMAMRAARRALQVQPQFPAAASLWLAANFRRENNLGEAKDPSYGAQMHSPHYYATLLGPSHLQPVLFRALTDGDAELARDAIRALDATATTAERLGEGIQPLIASLNYPDRRVRFEAAFAIARSLPRVDFSGAQRVVPVLAEAVRETAKPVILVIAPDLDAIKKTASLLGDEANYNMIFGDSLAAAAEQIHEAPGVDLLVTNLTPAQSLAVLSEARLGSKLMTTPALVFAPTEELATAGRMLAEHKHVLATDLAAEPAEVASAMQQAMDSVKGQSVTPEEALNYATTALQQLLNITRETGQTFVPADATPALIAALDDTRDPVVAGTARVLAQFNAAAAQQAIASAALDSERSEEMQAILYKALAESARFHGNLLNDSLTQLLLRAIRQVKGSVADAAAEAHGALDLPTANGVEQIIE